MLPYILPKGLQDIIRKGATENEGYIKRIRGIRPEGNSTIL
ncbi:MAG TPA: hypothetical protein VFZ67_06565 [Nitrososphaera sp.]